MLVKSAESEKIEAHAILKSMSRLVTALESEAETFQSKKDSFRRLTGDIIAWCSVSAIQPPGLLKK